MTAGAAVIVLQARMRSRRLPGKSLRLLAGRPLVLHCLGRLVRAPVGAVVLATTVDPSDDPLAAEVRRYGFPVWRGAVDDVLGRFVMVADRTGARYVIRATADNPAVDMDAPARVLQALKLERADYACEEGLPYGAAVEAITVDALRAAAAVAHTAADREHVTLFVKQRPGLFRCRTLAAPANLRRSDLRLTVDTAGDLDYMDAVLTAAACAWRPAPLAAVIRAADRVGRHAEVA